MYIRNSQQTINKSDKMYKLSYSTKKVEFIKGLKVWSNIQSWINVAPTTLIACRETPLLIDGEKVKCHNCFGRQFSNFIQNYKHTPTIPHIGIYTTDFILPKSR